MPNYADAAFTVAGGGRIRIDGLGVPMWEVLPKPAPPNASLYQPVVGFQQMKVMPTNQAARDYVLNQHHPGGSATTKRELNTAPS